jgi:hypothetical protein
MYAYEKVLMSKINWRWIPSAVYLTYLLVKLATLSIYNRF